MLSMKMTKKIGRDLVGNRVEHIAGETVLIKTISWYESKGIFVGLLPDGTRLVGTLSSLLPIQQMISSDGLTIGEKEYLKSKWGEVPLTLHELNALDHGV